MRLAIVGSTKFAEDETATRWASNYITWVLAKYKPELVISGGAIGIDQLAADVAAFEGIEVKEFLPLAFHAPARWPEYKARNILIAKACTHLLAIHHPLSTTYGSGWTADYAEKIGKKVARKAYKDMIV